jgi:hypothetical protein
MNSKKKDKNAYAIINVLNQILLGRFFENKNTPVRSFSCGYSYFFLVSFQFFSYFWRLPQNRLKNPAIHI